MQGMQPQTVIHFDIEFQRQQRTPAFFLSRCTVCQLSPGPKPRPKIDAFLRCEASSGTAARLHGLFFLNASISSQLQDPEPCIRCIQIRGTLPRWGVNVRQGKSLQNPSQIRVAKCCRSCNTYGKTRISRPSAREFCKWLKSNEALQMKSFFPTSLLWQLPFSHFVSNSSAKRWRRRCTRCIKPWPGR